MSDLLIESNYKNVETLSEATDNGKNWYIEGVFMQSDVVNRNRRIYPDSIMEEQIGLYNEGYVKTSRAIGELNHPPTPVVNPERASHKIVSIMKEGNNYIGKAMIIDTQVGKTVKALLEAGVQLGVSSRGMGSVKKNVDGINEVQSDFRLATVDIVYQPSAPDAFVTGLMEGETFETICESTIEEDTEFMESLRANLDTGKRWKLQEAKMEAFAKFLDHIKQK
jgi:hypothetical protein